MRLHTSLGATQTYAQMINIAKQVTTARITWNLPEPVAEGLQDLHIPVQSGEHHEDARREQHGANGEGLV